MIFRTFQIKKTKKIKRQLFEDKNKKKPVGHLVTNSTKNIPVKFHIY